VSPARSSAALAERPVAELPRGASAGGSPKAGSAEGDQPLLGIGAAAAKAGVSERALRYYQQLGLLNPSGRTPGGMRRYSEADLERVARIRELQQLLGLNLEEIAEVLAREDRLSEIRRAYRDSGTDRVSKRRLLEEGLALQKEMRRTVAAKREALEAFLADLDARIAKVERLLDEDPRSP